MKLVKVFDDLTLMPIGVMNLDQLRDEMGDAVVESVEVVDGNLVITFNTASGKQPITIPLSELSQPLFIETTYAELVAAKNGGTLAKGAWYRITDYVTTTSQSDTQSANHAFDVIVRADSESVLSENAFAIQHAGDTYFANQKLSAWELKYDINNDTTKYAWADATNGKGVIYYMKDENDNECPYDFKNIQFKVGAKQQAGTKYDVFYFTFSVATGENDATVTDHSLNGSYCYENKMELYVYSNKRQLNANIFRNTSTTSRCSHNVFGINCYNNTFGDAVRRNTFDSNNYENSFASNFTFNKMGHGNYYCKVNSDCADNTFGSECQSITIGSSCEDNEFGSQCKNITIGQGCKANIFKSNCSTITLGSSCLGNIFSPYCANNTLGNNNSYNIFGSSCTYNTLGKNCSYITFGNGCAYIKSGTASTTKDYYQNIIFENGIKYVALDCTQTTSGGAYCQNVLVGMGIQGIASSSLKTLTVATTKNAFKTVFKTANDVEVTA